MKRNGDFEAADWEARGVKLDGRQARPADDVGRSDGSAVRAVVDGWREAYEKWYAAAAAWQPPDAYDEDWCDAEAAYEAGFRAACEACERFRGGEAPHGEAPPDAEA